MKSFLVKTFGILAVIFICVSLYLSFSKGDSTKKENSNEVENDNNNSLVEIGNTSSTQKNEDKETEETDNEQTKKTYNPPTSLSKIKEEIEIERNILDSSKTEQFDTYELEDGRTVKISSASERADHYSDSDVSKAMDKATNMLYDFMTFDTFEPITILDRIEGKFGSNIRVELRNAVEGNEIPDYSNMETHGDFANGHSDFPFQQFLEMNENVSSRKVTSISLTENEDFTPPYLDLYATVNSTVVNKDGKEYNETHKFIITFNKQQERERSIYMFLFLND